MNIESSFYLLCFLGLFGACQAQNNKTQAERDVGGPCDGCEAIFEYGDKILTNVDILPTFEETEPQLKITGTVFKRDGETPAPNVILYIYHTDRNGRYTSLGNEKGWGKRHGSIRGWIKTAASGTYTFYTFRPAAYPGGTESEHIHITVKEPGFKAYYIDGYVFEDDPLLTAEKRKVLRNRGGSGITKPRMENGIYHIQRNIILGQNIPDYD